MGAHRFRSERIPVADLKPHPRVQRMFDETHAKKLADSFDQDQLGTLSVLKVIANQKSHYYVFDGQHRRWAAEQAAGPDRRLPCNVYEGLSDEDCARISAGINGSKAWTAIDKFINRIKFDDVAKKIAAIVEKNGLKISAQPTPGVVRAVVACEWVYVKCSPDALDRALRVLKESWGTWSEAFDSSLIKGLGLFLERYGSAIDERHLVRRLTVYGNPLRFIGHARELSVVAHKTMPRAVMMIFVEEYNKKMRGQNRIGEDE